MKYDVFISYASEDKGTVALPLANHLRNLDLRVWIDEFELTLGDSLRRCIDRGLAESRYGIVILSPAFFNKEWPKRELDGLAANEYSGQKVILPVWHNITANQVAEISPILADRVSISTERGIESIAESIMQVVRRDSQFNHTIIKHRDTKQHIQDVNRRIREQKQLSKTRKPLTILGLGLIIIIVAVVIAHQLGYLKIGEVHWPAENKKNSASISERFDSSDAALVRAGMYVGQASLRLGETSKSLRRNIYSNLQKAGIDSETVESIDSLMQTATNVGAQSEAVKIVGEVFEQANMAADRLNPAFGREAFSFGMFFGMTVMGINGLVDIPEMDHNRSRKVLNDLQKAMKPEFLSAVLNVKDKIPFPQRMKLTLESMFKHERSTLNGWEQMASDAAFFSYLLWKVAEEGGRALDRHQILSDREYASQMSLRLENEGFSVKIPGIPSRQPAFPGGEIK